MTITVKQLSFIKQLLKKQNKPVDEQQLESMSKGEACELISKLTGETTEQAPNKPESKSNNGDEITAGMVFKKTVDVMLSNNWKTDDAIAWKEITLNLASRLKETREILRDSLAGGQ